MAIVKAIDEMKACCEVSLRAGCKGGYFFMPHMHPLNAFALRMVLVSPFKDCSPGLSKGSQVFA